MEERPYKIQKTIRFLNINDLPNEILVYLFLFMDKEELIPLLFVNKRLYQVVSSKTLLSNERVDFHIYAAYRGLFSLLKWSINYLGYPILESDIIDAAARNGFLDIIKWAREEGCPWSEDASILSASCDHWKILQWITENGCPYNEGIDFIVGERGDTEIIEYIWKIRSPQCHEQLCLGIIESGNLEMLEWITSSGCEWQNVFIISIISLGNLDMLEWTMSFDCTLKDHQLVTTAISYGQLNILKGLKDMGMCPWTISHSDKAMVLGKFDVLKWAIENGFPHTLMHRDALQAMSLISP